MGSPGGWRGRCVAKHGGKEVQCLPCGDRRPGPDKCAPWPRDGVAGRGGGGFEGPLGVKRQQVHRVVLGSQPETGWPVSGTCFRFPEPSRRRLPGGSVLGCEEFRGPGTLLLWPVWLAVLLVQGGDVPRPEPGGGAGLLEWKMGCRWLGPWPGWARAQLWGLLFPP